MIQVPCKCGYQLEVPQDQAGGVIQCPECGLAVDIPTLSDLPNLLSDGTFVFTADQRGATDPAPFNPFHFVNRATDYDGQEKDLRHSVDYFRAIPLAADEPPRPKPRYDPVTGELIRPIPVKDEAPKPVLSFGEIVDPSEIDNEPAPPPPPLPPIILPKTSLLQARQLKYATGDAAHQITARTLLIELFMPANATVMFFVYLLCVITCLTTSAIASYAGRFFQVVWPFILADLPLWLLLSHLGCVIEATGPDAIDELPRPLRDFSLDEDIFTPLFRVLLAGFICFGPMVLVIVRLNHANPATLPLVILLGIFGAALMPAVLLTTVTGTTVLNLRPDRVLEVIRLCGGQYLISMLLFVLMIVPSVYYLTSELLFPQILMHYQANPWMYAILWAVVYLQHLFAWHLGLMYRQNHEQFPWLAQRHVKRNSKSQIPVV